MANAFERIGRRLWRRTAAFARARDGNFAIISALTFLPLAIGAIGAVDVAHALKVRSELQAAVDAAVLAGASFANKTLDERQGEADAVFQANLSTVEAPDGQLLKEGSIYTYGVDYSVPTTILQLIDLDMFDLSVRAQATDAQQNLDVVFVLDSSGSMGNGTNRMTELKKAVQGFLGHFVDTNGRTQIALVPFDSQVRVSTTLLTSSTSAAPLNPYAPTTVCSSLLDDDDRAACSSYQQHFIVDCGSLIADSRADRDLDGSLCRAEHNGFVVGTTGAYFFGRGNPNVYRYAARASATQVTITREEGRCVSPRNDRTGMQCASFQSAGTGTLTIYRETLPNPNTLPANRYLLTSGETWAGCLVDRTQDYDASADAPTTANAATLYPKAACAGHTLQPVHPLDPDLEIVESKVSQLQPSGATNVTIGVQWGMEALSASAPLTGVREDSVPIMILLTDGENTQNRWTGTGTANQPASVLQALADRTKSACSNAKDSGIEIFAVNLIDGDPAVLQSCATDESHYFAVKTASELTKVFADIAGRIRTVRLTS